jgi:hypothetical protein
MDNFLTKPPNKVIRWLSGNKFPCASFASVMDLNLMIKKGWASFPGRSWKKKIFPLFCQNNTTQVINNIGESAINKQVDSNKSKSRFPIFLYITRVDFNSKITRLMRRTAHSHHTILLPPPCFIKFNSTQPNRSIFKF